MAKIRDTLVISGDRCANCGQYFSFYRLMDIKKKIKLSHMCPPRTRKVRNSFTEQYKMDYLHYLLKKDEFNLMWRTPKQHGRSKDNMDTSC